VMLDDSFVFWCGSFFPWEGGGVGHRRKGVFIHINNLYFFLAFKGGMCSQQPINCGTVSILGSARRQEIILPFFLFSFGVLDNFLYKILIFKFPRNNWGGGGRSLTNTPHPPSRPPKEKRTNWRLDVWVRQKVGHANWSDQPFFSFVFFGKLTFFLHFYH
jgi:hypothetical protein